MNTADAPTQDLVAKIRAGDSQALADLLSRYGSEVRGVAYMILRNDADADEVAEDTFVTAWLKIGSLRQPTAMRSWLLSIAARKAIGLRRARRPTFIDSLALSMTAPDPTTRFSEQHAVNRALGSLPQATRAAMTLHYVADMTVDQVANALGRSRNTVKSQLQDGLRQMRRSLGDGLRVR